MVNNNIKKAYFAGGCFWGTEHYYLDLDGVTSTKVGYMGGSLEKPTYEKVSTGTTGHAETLEVTYDDSRINFEDLAKLFFEIHDSTQIDRQGPDIGDQYRSVIFYVDNEQKKISEKLISFLKKERGLKIATKLIKAEQFWNAEEYHQKYYTKTGGTPYCHIRKKIF